MQLFCWLHRVGFVFKKFFSWGLHRTPISSFCLWFLRAPYVRVPYLGGYAKAQIYLYVNWIWIISFRQNWLPLEIGNLTFVAHGNETFFPDIMWFRSKIIVPYQLKQIGSLNQCFIGIKYEVDCCVVTSDENNYIILIYVQSRERTLIYCYSNINQH